MAIKQVFVSDFDNTKEFATLAEQLAFDAAERHKGKINAFLTSDPALYRAYADNVA